MGLRREIQVNSIADDEGYIWIRDGVHGGIYKYDKNSNEIVDEIRDDSMEIFTEERLFMACDSKLLILAGHKNPERVFIWNKGDRTLEKRVLSEIKGKIIGIEIINDNIVFIPYSVNDSLYIVSLKDWCVNNIEIDTGNASEELEAWGYSYCNGTICLSFLNADFYLIISCEGNEVVKKIKMLGESITSSCVADEQIYLLTKDNRILIRGLSNSDIDEIVIPKDYVVGLSFIKILSDTEDIYVLPLIGNNILKYTVDTSEWNIVNGTLMLEGLKEDDTMAQYWYWYKWNGKSVFLPFRHNILFENDVLNDYKLLIPETIGDADIQKQDNYRFLESAGGENIAVETEKFDLNFFLRYVNSI